MKETNHSGNSFRINRKHKDRLFCFIFSDKKNALMLYNAINSSNHTDVNDLEIYTISDAVYIRMKNDVAYLISNTMALYEQQSTINPNMPVRGFMYFGELYSKYIETNKLSVHGSKLIKLPSPQYIVFYNGSQSFPEKKTLKLSDAFIEPVEPGTFEWTATVYNINSPFNTSLKENCKPLNDYMIFIEKVRKYSYTLSIEEAVDRSCRECIKENVLKEILLAHRAEVIKMCITEFDERAYEKSYMDMIDELNAQHAEDIQELNGQISQQSKQISQLLARIKELESNQTIH